METLVFLVDAVAIVLLVLFSLRDDRTKPGTPTTGLFRFNEFKVVTKTTVVPSYLQQHDEPTARKDGRS